MSLNSVYNNANITGSVKVLGRNKKPMVGHPVEVQLLNSKLSPQNSYWTGGGYYSFDSLSPGIYVIRAKLANGVERDQVVEVNGESLVVDIVLEDENSDFFYDATFNSKGLGLVTEPPEFYRDKFSFKYRESIDDVALWEQRDGIWNKVQNSILDVNFIFLPDRFNLTMPRVGNFGIEVLSKQWPSKFFFLPQVQEVDLTISYSEIKGLTVNPIQLKIKSLHWGADTLLTLLAKGPVSEDGSLFREIEAEFLFQDKVRNPAAAAIGGYYLLKIRALDRMHDWANNMANWFPWMPDGAVIHAWQLMAQEIKTARDVSKIRDRLLEANRRGIPHYTEGLRLLHEGLEKIAAYYKGRDFGVDNALKSIRKYVAAADMSQPMTTLNSLRPKSRMFSLVNSKR